MEIENKFHLRSTDLIEVCEIDLTYFDLLKSDGDLIEVCCLQVYLRHWAYDLNVPILSVDYSLAPEYQFPYQLEEAFFAYCWAIKNCHLLGLWIFLSISSEVMHTRVSAV